VAGYWVPSVLAQLLPQPIVGSALVGASTLPINLTSFQIIIDENSAKFDMAAAKAGYVIPIPSTASGYIAAQAVTRDGITADLLRIVYTGPDSHYIDRFQQAFDAALKAIEQGDRPLPGAPPDPAADGRLLPVWVGVPSKVISGTYGYPQDLGIPNDF
jgi:hypothetical protein